MKFTNVHNLPQSIVDALTHNSYDLSNAPDNILSVTSLISPPAIRQLEKRHWADIEVDVAEKLSALSGQAIHHVLDQSNQNASTERLTEERWYMNLETFEVYFLGQVERITKMDWFSKDVIYISGRLDVYDAVEKSLDDYKNTSVWSVIIEKKAKDEWVAQNNINAYVVRKLGYTVEQIRNILLLKDWSKKEARAKPEYPQCAIHVFQNPVWTDEQVEKFMTDRVIAHVSAMALKDEDLPTCSDKERWAKAPSFAVMKTGNVRAVRVFPDKESAETLLAEKGKGHYVDFRPGADIRCEDYCNVSEWCKYMKQKCAGKAG
jgi:hypothetical protein